ncbi:MAG: hypothetical protein WCC36_07725 [Gammaproteobacteria bacterium]
MRFFAFVIECPLGQSAAGDVADDAFKPGHIPVRIMEVAHVDQYPYAMPLPVSKLHLVVVEVAIGIGQALQELGALVRAHIQVRDRLAEQFVQGVAGQRLSRGACIDQAAGDVHAVQSVPHIADDQRRILRGYLLGREGRGDWYVFGCHGLWCRRLFACCPYGASGAD